MFSDQIKEKIPESWSCIQEYLLPYSLSIVFYTEDFIWKAALIAAIEGEHKKWSNHSDTQTSGYLGI